MPFKSYAYPNAGEGIDRRYRVNHPRFPKGALWDLRNMVYERDSEDPEKMRGITQLGTNGINGACLGLYDYDEGTRLVACSADGGIYERATGDWTAATGGAAGTFTTTGSKRWAGCMFYGDTLNENILILANDDDADAPQSYDATNGVQALAGSPPAHGKYPVSFMGRVALADGSLLYFSEVNDAETWTAGSTFNVQVDRGTGAITGLAVFQGVLIIFKRRAIYKIEPASSIDTVSVQRIASGVGCVSHHTIQEVLLGGGSGEGLAFLSDSGVMALVATQKTGGFSYKNISGKIKAVLDLRSRTYQAQNWATFNPERLEYWLQYGTTSATPSFGVIANTAREQRPLRWTRHDRPNLTAGTMYQSSGQEVQVVGDAAGDIYQMHSGDAWIGGAGYTGTYWTAAYNQGRMDYMKQYNRWFVDASVDGTYNVAVNATLGRKALPLPPLPNEALIDDFGRVQGWGVGEWGVALWGGGGVAGVHYRFEGSARGHYARMKISTTGANQWFKVHGLMLEATLGAPSIAA